MAERIDGVRAWVEGARNVLEEGSLMVESLEAIDFNIRKGEEEGRKLEAKRVTVERRIEKTLATLAVMNAERDGYVKKGLEVEEGNVKLREVREVLRTMPAYFEETCLKRVLTQFPDGDFEWSTPPPIKKRSRK